MSSRRSEFRAVFVRITTIVTAAMVSSCSGISDRAFDGLLAGDTIHVQNAIGDYGLLVDGAESNSEAVINDARHTPHQMGDTFIDVGQLTTAEPPHRNEAIAFGESRSPYRQETSWTTGNDSFTFPLGDQLEIPVTNWIVYDHSGNQRDLARNACIDTSTIWAAERMGIQISECEVIYMADQEFDDAILNSVGEDHRNWDDFSNEVGIYNDRINVYWIETVDGQATAGWSDFGNRIVMGWSVSGHLLAHELGHALSLLHPVELCNRASRSRSLSNVMCAYTNHRNFLSEGQIFRAHFNGSSALNATYDVRQGDPVTACIEEAQTEECPALDERLWPD